MLIRNSFLYTRPYRDKDDDGGGSADSDGEMSPEELAIARGDVLADGEGVETDIGEGGSQKSEEDVARDTAKAKADTKADVDDTKDEKSSDTKDEKTSEKADIKADVEEEVKEEVEDVKKDVKAEVDAEEEKKQRDSQMVPRSRLDAKNRILRETQAKLKATEERLKSAGVDVDKSASPQEEAVAEFDTQIVEAEKALIQAKKDGDVEAEVAALGKIRSLERKQYQTQLDIAKKAATSEAVASAKYTDTLDALEQLIPAINPDDEDSYDEDAVDEMRELVEAFEAKGYDSSEALVAAANYVFPEAMNVESISDQREKSDAAKKAEQERTAAAKRKAAEAVAKTAPSTKGVGDDGDKAGAKDAVPDGEKLTEEEFDKLPDSTKARMRGDFL